ncbi:hypothetical protein EC913_12468 [Pseudomonas sp. LP_4_YM]|nr:hypothetical protein EC913_12468 [Pseudomonas sp. LP_4_YM]TFA87912.1 hypothetical protein F473_03482 [Pseudomonas sp. URIL14HWK12:I1]SNB81018.1 hypothetical protein SAMN02746026_03609 [Pseudomonas sp. LAIL14HWK12:I4]
MIFQLTTRPLRGLLSVSISERQVGYGERQRKHRMEQVSETITA